MGSGSSDAVFEFFFPDHHSRLSKTTKDSVRLQESEAARKALSLGAWRRARTRGQLATKQRAAGMSSNTLQVPLLAFFSLWHCLPQAKAKQKPKNNEAAARLQSLLRHKEKRLWQEHRAQTRLQEGQGGTASLEEQFSDQDADFKGNQN